MASSYNARKAAQVIAFFAQKERKQQLNVLKAVKLVYLADRLCMKENGFPVLDEPRVSMRHGPVNSITYDCIKGAHPNKRDESDWEQFLSDRENYLVRSVREFDEDDFDELSEAEIECLEQTWGEFGHFDKWELVKLTHDKSVIPEWEDPKGSSKPITLVRILTEVGCENPEEQAEAIQAQEQVSSFFQSLRTA